MAAIRLDGVTKRYSTRGNSVLAVDDLDLVVQEGEIFGFLGPNGAGKSTTIDMLLGFIEPTAGEIEVVGRNVRTDSKAAREHVGYLPDGYDVFQRLTAREHIKWVRDIRNSDDDVDDILELVGLIDASDRRAGTYSKGMQQRLALGMALVGDPKLLILDEPSSGLDPTGMHEIRGILREMADRGVTVFFSSHILSEVEAVCDRVGILNRGTLAIVDTIENLRRAAGGAIRFNVQEVPDISALKNIDGVKTVTVETDWISVSCDGVGTKIAVVRWIDQQTTILDILSEDTSLEELFTRYTTRNHEASGEQTVSEVTE